MNTLTQLFTQNSAQDWGIAFLAASGFILAMDLLRRIVLRRLGAIAKTTDTVIDDFLMDVLAATRILLSAAVGIYLGLHFLSLPPAMEKVVDRAFIGLLILQCGFWANRGLVFWLTYRFSQGDQSDAGSRAMTQSLLTFMGRMVVWLVVVLLALDNIGVNVTALVASLGIGGIAVALAVQNILSDLFASLSIAIDKPFVIGDFITVDDLAGTVQHVGLKTTRIHSLSGEQLVISNNDLLKSRIHNYKKMQERRIVFSVRIAYDASAQQLAQVPTLIKQTIDALPLARFDRSHFKEFGSYALNFETVYFVRSPDYNVYMDLQQAINLQLFHTFSEHKIAFAFPTQTLHLNGGVSFDDAKADGAVP